MGKYSKACLLRPIRLASNEAVLGLWRTRAGQGKTPFMLLSLLTGEFDFLRSDVQEMQEPRHLLEQWHPIPLSFGHILNYYKHFVTVLQSILQKPLEARLKESTWERAVNFAFSCSPFK